MDKAESGNGKMERVEVEDEKSGSRKMERVEVEMWKE